jgi:isocitrate/isopropylmalate dehydrogenase
VIEMGVSTKDIGGNASTSEVGDRVAEELEGLLRT